MQENKTVCHPFILLIAEFLRKQQLQLYFHLCKCRITKNILHYKFSIEHLSNESSDF